MRVLFLYYSLVVPDVQISVRACGDQNVFEEGYAIKYYLGLVLFGVALIRGQIFVSNFDKIGGVLNIVVLKGEYSVVVPLGHIIIATEEEGEFGVGEELDVVDELVLG